MRRLAIKVPPNRITIKHCTFRWKVYLVCPLFPQCKKKLETNCFFFLRVHFHLRNDYISITLFSVIGTQCLSTSVLIFQVDQNKTPRPLCEKYLSVFHCNGWLCSKNTKQKFIGLIIVYETKYNLKKKVLSVSDRHCTSVA